MESTIQEALTAAVLKLIRPLVRVLLRHGMAYGTFAELARKAFVDEGFSLVEESGKRPTVSAVSALTGLTRKETKRLNDLEWVDEAASSARFNRAIRVISGWTEDSSFQQEDGTPAVLSLEGDDASFASLVKRYSGDIPPAAMLSLLEASGTVVCSEQGVCLLAKAYIPVATPLEKIHILGSDVAELIDTIGHNLSASSEEFLFQRKVSNVLVHPDALEAFRKLSNEKSQLLLEEYHSWLSNHEVDTSEESNVDPRYVAVGIYYSEYRTAAEVTP